MPKIIKRNDIHVLSDELSNIAGGILKTTDYDLILPKEHNDLRPDLISYVCPRGWLDCAMVLGKLPVPGRPSNLANSRARAYCACSECGWGHRYLGSVIFAFKTTLTTTLNSITCINTFGHGLKKKTLFAINALFTKDNNLSKTKVGGSLQKTIATC